MKITGIRTKQFEFQMSRRLGDSPGHGLSFDEQALERFAAEQLSPESKPSPWGRRRGAGLYIVPADQPHELPDA